MQNDVSYSTPTSLLTAEQLAIVSHRIGVGETLVANAFAGCGKTSTVLARIERHPLHAAQEAKGGGGGGEGGGALTSTAPPKPILYVAFNTTTQKEMEKRIKHAGLVESRTYHSLALRFTGWALGRRVVINMLKPGNFPSYSSPARILKRYWKDAGKDGWASEPQRSHMQPRDTERDLSSARVAWRKMLTSTSPDATWTHDATLKYFAMSGARSEEWINSLYCELVVDEAQDVQAVFLHWLLGLKSLPLLLVGDAYQSIYSFAGANNAIQDAIESGKDGLKSVQILNLTRSFRFGARIAQCATRLLHHSTLLSPSIVVTGTETLVGCVLSNYKLDVLALPRGPITCIARGNATIFEVAMRAISQGRFVRFVGRSHELMSEMSELLKKYKTSAAVSARIRQLRRKGSAHGGDDDDDDESGEGVPIDAVSFSIQLSDADRDELEKLNMVVATGYEKLSRALATMKEQSRKRKHDPNELTLCTVHGAKGLEWDRVFMCDDFPCLDRLVWALKQAQTPRSMREYYKLRFPLAGSCSCVGYTCRANHAARLLFEANLIVEPPETQRLQSSAIRREVAERFKDDEDEEEDNKINVEKIREELHVYYVAMTRAKRILYANCALASVLAPLLSKEEDMRSQKTAAFFAPRHSSASTSNNTSNNDNTIASEKKVVDLTSDGEEEEEEQEQQQSKRIKKFF